MLSRRWTKVMKNTDSQEADLQWQPVDNEDKALALHSDVLNFQTLGRKITFLLSLPSIHETEKG